MNVDNLKAGTARYHCHCPRTWEGANCTKKVDSGGHGRLQPARPLVW